MTESYPIFLMPIGIPGSGKTTWINTIINEFKFIIICPDLIRKEVTGKISDMSKDSKVWRLAKKRVKKALKQKSNVILDATNVNGRYRREFLKKLPPCILQAKIFDISPEEAKKRIKNDITDDIDRSHVPIDVIDAMYEKFITESSLEQLKEDGFEII